MKKRILACMLIVAMVGIGVVFAAAESTGTISSLNGTPNEDTKLTLTWDFNDTKETYIVGFSDAAPAERLNQPLATKSPVDTLAIEPYGQNTDSLYKGIQDVWVYWDIYTNKAFDISIKASGPLKYGVESAQYFNNLINWKATWTPCETNSAGQVTEKVSGPVVLGKVDNDFGDMTYSSGQDYANDPPAEYTAYKAIYTQAKDDTAPMGKKGFAKLSIETQNTRDSGITEDYKKSIGSYSASLTLKISTPV